MPTAEELLNAGELTAALARQKECVRESPGDAGLRFQLFDLMALDGQWSAAENQLRAAAGLAPDQAELCQLLEKVVAGEREREEVVRGAKPPEFLWDTPDSHPLPLAACGRTAEAKAERLRLLSSPPPCAGLLNGAPFRWLLEGDSRFGPHLEAIIDGRYCLVAQPLLAEISMLAPEFPRDLVWVRAKLLFRNGDASVAHLPARHPMAASWQDEKLRLGRLTQWDSPVPDWYEGRGGKSWFSDTGENEILAVRSVVFDSSAP